MAGNLSKTAAIAYDATHGYSDQYIVEVDKGDDTWYITRETQKTKTPVLLINPLEDIKVDPDNTTEHE